MGANPSAQGLQGADLAADGISMVAPGSSAFGAEMLCCVFVVSPHDTATPPTLIKTIQPDPNDLTLGLGTRLVLAVVADRQRKRHNVLWQIGPSGFEAALVQFGGALPAWLALGPKHGKPLVMRDFRMVSFSVQVLEVQKALL